MAMTRSTLTKETIAMIASVVLMLILPAQLAAPSPLGGEVNGAYPGHEASKNPSSGTALLQDPFLTLPGKSFSAGVGAFTSDPDVANNTGLNTTIALPSSFTLPADGCVSNSNLGICVFLGVEEPISSTTNAFVGAVIATTGSSTVALGAAILPNGTLVTSYPSDSLVLGHAYTFSFLHSSGTWWDFEYNGNLITGASAWQNGTFNLNQPVATGLGTGGVGTGSVSQGPMQFVAELGSSTFSLPQVDVTWAIGIERANQSSPTYQPTSGNAALLNASYPVGIVGHDQNSSLPLDHVQEAGDTVFLGVADSLWGYATPLGALTPQVAVYSTETTAAGNGGIGFALTVPTFSLSKGQLEFSGVQMPFNSTVQIGVGVMFSEARAVPYYFVRSSLSVSLYPSISQALTVGSSVALKAQAQANGWWSFTENGAPIVNSPTGDGNGTAYLGSATAAAFIGSTIDPSVSTFSSSAFPMLGLYGNGTMKLLDASSALLFSEPGRGWIPADYANGWCWNATQQGSGEVCNTAATSAGIEGNEQDVIKVPRWEVLLGTGVPYKMTTQSSLVWSGVLNVSVAVSPEAVTSGQSTTVEVTVTSSLALPSPIDVYGTGNLWFLTFNVSSTGSYWGTYVATYYAPNLTSSSPTQVNITIEAFSPPDFEAAYNSTVLTVSPPQLFLQARAAYSTITAGQTDTLSIWVNNSQGPVTGAAINATVTPAGGQGYLGTISQTTTAGLYAATFAPPVTVTSNANYTVTFYANAIGGLTGIGSINLSVAPLPVLSVAVAIQSTAGSGSFSGGEPLTIVVTVSSPSQYVSGALVVITSSVSWLNKVSGITNSTGVFGMVLKAPNETATTLIKVSVTASLSGYRSGSGTVSLTVVPPPHPPSTKSSISGIYTWIAVGVGVVVVVVVVLLFRRKLTKGRPEKPVKKKSRSSDDKKHPVEKKKPKKKSSSEEKKPDSEEKGSGSEEKKPIGKKKESTAEEKKPSGEAGSPME
jgi:hypothetical protein